VPETSAKLSNLYTLDQISAQLSIPLDELKEILDFYRPRNFPSVTVGSDTLYTEQVSFVKTGSLPTVRTSTILGRMRF